jgi:type IX secretion system PorP/SprF family membrane protein
MIKKTHTFFLWMSALCCLSATAQDIHFSQFTQAPLALNPALAGTTVWLRGVMQYKSQWKAVSTVPYTTMNASFDIKAKKQFSKNSKGSSSFRKANESGFGWGVNVYKDIAGDGKMGSLVANGSLAYQLPAGEKEYIAFGFQGGIMQRSINVSNLTWGTQYSPSSSSGYNLSLPADKSIAGGRSNFISPDISVGGVYTYKNEERYVRGTDQKEYSIGLAAYHLYPVKYSFIGSNEKLSRRYVAYGQGIFGVRNSPLAIVPAFVIQKQGPNQEIVFGSLFRYMLEETSKYTGYTKSSCISMGGYYRAKDALVLATLFEFSIYGIGLSYDFNISKLTPASSGRGGLEFTLRILNPAPFLFNLK